MTLVDWQSSVEWDESTLLNCSLNLHLAWISVRMDLRNVAILIEIAESRSAHLQILSISLFVCQLHLLPTDLVLGCLVSKEQSNYHFITCKVLLALNFSLAIHLMVLLPLMGLGGHIDLWVLILFHKLGQLRLAGKGDVVEGGF